MIKILILAVNYNTYPLLNTYLKSLELASNFAVDIEVAIADNTPLDCKKNITLDRKYPIIVYDYLDNPGYINSLIRMWDDYYYSKSEEFDFVIMSNVDLSIDNSFWKYIQTIKTEKIAWIAPNVHTLRNNQRENPFMISRPSLNRMSFFKFIYLNPFIYNSYVLLSKLLRSNCRNDNSKMEQIIYAGHGSIFIFTKQFTQFLDKIRFTPYMYGEEIFFAELVRKASLKTKYFPKLLVNNIGLSAGKLRGNKWKCRVSRESIKFLINSFWK